MDIYTYRQFIFGKLEDGHEELEEDIYGPEDNDGLGRISIFFLVNSNNSHRY